MSDNPETFRVSAATLTRISEDDIVQNLRADPDTRMSYQEVLGFLRANPEDWFTFEPDSPRVATSPHVAFRHYPMIEVKVASGTICIRLRPGEDHSKG